MHNSDYDVSDEYAAELLNDPYKSYEQLLDDDEITVQEAAFLEGYDV